MNLNLLGKYQKYVEETYEEYNERYNSWGKGLYEYIKIHEPNIFRYLKFYKAVELLEKSTLYEPCYNDSYAIYEDKNCSFLIHIDSETKIICLSNIQNFIEIGDYGNNDYFYAALIFIKDELTQNKYLNTEYILKKSPEFKVIVHENYIVLNNERKKSSNKKIMLNEITSLKHKKSEINWLLTFVSFIISLGPGPNFKIEKNKNILIFETLRNKYSFELYRLDESIFYLLKSRLEKTTHNNG